MLKNKTQVARESIKNPEASRALKRALDPTVEDYGIPIAPVMSIMSLRPPPQKKKKKKNPGSALHASDSAVLVRKYTQHIYVNYNL